MTASDGELDTKSVTVNVTDVEEDEDHFQIDLIGSGYDPIRVKILLSSKQMVILVVIQILCLDFIIH